MLLPRLLDRSLTLHYLGKHYYHFGINLLLSRFIDVYPKQCMYYRTKKTMAEHLFRFIVFNTCIIDLIYLTMVVL